ncbi:MAG: fibrillarin-like rRNA/tRNA 2'-O-methyltransferase [Candidatus Altiarchaeota archaeon]
MKEIFPGVFRLNSEIATENSLVGFRVYGEKLLRKNGKEFRVWDPYRSKLAAGILNGLKFFPISKRTNVLYLGASSGTTASHIADITKGFVFCVEFSSRMMQELVQICEKRKNMVPIFADANKPEQYTFVSLVDLLYQDISQKNQAEILLKNSEYFMPEYAMLAIKARSINSIQEPKKIFNQEIDKLKSKFQVLQIIDLKPYDKDHVLVNLKLKR